MANRLTKKGMDLKYSVFIFLLIKVSNGSVPNRPVGIIISSLIEVGNLGINSRDSGVTDCL